MVLFQLNKGSTMFLSFMKLSVNQPTIVFRRKIIVCRCYMHLSSLNCLGTHNKFTIISPFQHNTHNFTRKSIYFLLWEYQNNSIDIKWLNMVEETPKLQTCPHMQSGVYFHYIIQAKRVRIISNYRSVNLLDRNRQYRGFYSRWNIG